MGLMVGLVLCLMFLLLFVGLRLIGEWERDEQIVGSCTLAWVAVAAYLLFTQWLPDPYHPRPGLMTIFLLTLGGYAVGRLIVWIRQKDWLVGAIQK